MFNRDDVRKKSATGPKQILANVEMQAAVGCIVDDATGIYATVDGRKIVKAGTPLKIVLETRNTTAAVLATASVVMNAVLLHDVDVTDGKANGTALLFGFINLNRVDTDVQTKITTARTATGVSPLLVFLKS